MKFLIGSLYPAGKDDMKLGKFILVNLHPFSEVVGSAAMKSHDGVDSGAGSRDSDASSGAGILVGLLQRPCCSCKGSTDFHEFSQK